MPSEVLTPESLRAAALAALPGSAVFAVDRDMRLLLCDGPALATHGYDAASLVGRPLADVAPANAYADLEPLYRAALEGELPRLEHHSTDGDALVLDPHRPADATATRSWAPWPSPRTSAPAARPTTSCGP